MDRRRGHRSSDVWTTVRNPQNMKRPQPDTGPTKEPSHVPASGTAGGTLLSRHLNMYHAGSIASARSRPALSDSSANSSCPRGLSAYVRKKGEPTCAAWCATADLTPKCCERKLADREPHALSCSSAKSSPANIPPLRSFGHQARRSRATLWYSWPASM
eukprot:2169515-Prymnesium_polylepis.2